MIDLFELRIVALVGLIAVMIGTALLVRVGVAVAERLRPVWERMRGRPVRKAAVARVRC
jgi:hypothetical protein